MGDAFIPAAAELAVAQEQFALSANGFVKCILLSATGPGCSGAKPYPKRLPQLPLPGGSCLLGL